MADYVSSLTGVAMDAALMDMAEHNSEAFAVGERNGVPVNNGDVTYHNNARYYAQQAQSIAPASVTEAVRWDVAQTALTDANKEQARENIDAGKNGAWSNRNLLDNWYFVGGGSQLGDGVFPINQRGQSTYTGGGVQLDRWRTWAGDDTIVLTANGVQYTSPTSNGIFQYFPYFPCGDDTCTFSAKIGGTIYSVTLPEGQNDATFWGVGFALIVNRSNNTVGIISANTTILLQAVKLEKGSISTLANDAPPKFRAELENCQQYLWQKAFPAVSQIGTGVAVDANNCVVDVVLPVSMRIGAGISFTANVLLIGAGGSTIAASVSSITIIDNHARLNVVAASALSVNNLYSFFTSTETVMTISAEI